MKNILAQLLALFCCITGVAAQKHYVSAIWTRPDGAQTEILIDFQQWETTPERIFYKRAATATEEALLPADVRLLQVKSPREEFYIGLETELAVFSKTPSANREIQRRQKPIFLRTLIAGTLSLYKYREENGVSHYFIKNDTLLEELIYHEYYVDEQQNSTRKHQMFRRQLLRATYDCPKIAKQIQTFRLSEQALKHIILQYNSATCKGRLDYQEEKTKGDLQFLVRAGGALTVNETQYQKSSGRNTVLQPKFGLSAQYVLPRELQRKALLLDVLYDPQVYETSQLIVSRIEKNFLQFHVSLRQYFPTRTVAPFINGGIFIAMPVGKTTIRANSWIRDYSPVNQSGLGFGGGIRWKQLELEIRLTANQLFGAVSGDVTSSIGVFATAGYRLF